MDVLTTGIIYACFVACSITADQRNYDGYEVWRVEPRTKKDVEFLKNLVLTTEIDYWSEPTIPGKPVDILIHPDLDTTLRSTLETERISFHTHIDNVQQLILKQTRREIEIERKDSREVRSILDFDYNVYHDYDEVMEWMNTIRTEFPDNVTMEQIGVTYEGRPMYVLKFASGGDADKPVIFIDSLIHSREWITTASLLFIFKEMMTNPLYKHMLEGANWYFVPMINIDGYVETWTKDRLWRKTKSTGPSSLCTGVDANRNWDSYWSVSGSSNNPCTNLYHGPTPESEPVIRHLARYVSSLGKIDGYVSTHSYSQYILYPYNYANITTPDYELQDSTGEKMKSAIYAVHGTEYTNGLGATVLYEFSGTTSDWTYDQAGVKLSYTFELRDTGEYGFLLPPEQIIPTGEEYLAALAAFKHEIMNL